MNRRSFVAGGVSALALASPVAALAASEGWPKKIVRLVVAYPPGGATDAQARFVAEKLSQRWGQTVLVDNKAGGSTVIATSAVATAPPDGHTLLLTAMPFALNPLLMDTLPYDSEKDLTPVTNLTTISNVLVAHPSLGVKTVTELIQKAKASPGTINFASTGTATSTHLSGELFCKLAGVNMTHVPYKGSAPAHQDLLAGRVQIMFDNGVLQHIKTGRVTPLGVTSDKRLPWLPDVPTIAEQGLPGYEAAAWYGIFAPGGTPAELVSRIASDITWAVRSPDLAPKLETIGATAAGGTPQEFKRYLDHEKQRWGALIRERGIKIG